MPDATSASTSTTSWANNYLSGQPPAWAALQSGLSIFAIVVILRFCIRRLRLWISQSDSRNACRTSRPKSVVWQDTLVKDQLPPPEQNQSWRRIYQDFPRTMNEKQRKLGTTSGGSMRGHHHVSFSSDEPPTARGALHVDQGYNAVSDGPLRHVMSRPPPAPPLTPPELSTTVFTLQGGPHSQDSLIHQSNPDYTSPSTASPGSRPGTASTTSHARRLSYNKTIPIGIPISRQSSESEADLFFSPSSYPPSSPLLPPAPPTTQSASGPGEEPFTQREIELHGQIVGVLDDNGTGWTRHTRVYGGGVCMACAAAGREHGEGGFYGPNVLPEEMR